MGGLNSGGMNACNLLSDSSDITHGGFGVSFLKYLDSCNEADQDDAVRFLYCSNASECSSSIGVSHVAGVGGMLGPRLGG